MNGKNGRVRYMFGEVRAYRALSPETNDLVPEPNA